MSWTEQAESLEALLMKSIKELGGANRADELFNKWRFKIASPHIAFEKSPELFDSNAEAEAALKKLAQKYAFFLKEYEALGLTAMATLSEAGERFCVNSVSEDIAAIEEAVNAALLDITKMRVQWKELGISDTQRKNISLDGLIGNLLEAYTDITGQDIKFAYDPYKEKPTGRVYTFCAAFVKIMYPEVKENTLLDRMKTVHQRCQKLAEIQ